MSAREKKRSAQQRQSCTGCKKRYFTPTLPRKKKGIVHVRRSKSSYLHRFDILQRFLLPGIWKKKNANNLHLPIKSSPSIPRKKRHSFRKKQSSGAYGALRELFNFARLPRRSKSDIRMPQKETLSACFSRKKTLRKRENSFRTFPFSSSFLADFGERS